MNNLFKLSMMALPIALLSACISQPNYTHNPQGQYNPYYNPNHNYPQNPVAQQPQQSAHPKTRGVPQRYQVKSGDTVAKIASRYGLNWREVSALNRLDSKHTVKRGQWLTLWTDKTNTSTRPTEPTNNAPIYNQNVYSPQPVQPTQPQYQPNTRNAGLMKFEYPVGKDNRVIRNFGSLTNINGISTPAEGMWFAGQRGDTVKASRDGIVIFADGTPTGGAVGISHTDGFVSTYLHLQDVNVRQGQLVKAGDKIASMRQQMNGATVLEFRIAQNNVYIDPLAVLK